MNESIINEAQNYRRLKKTKIMKSNDGKDELSETNEIPILEKIMKMNVTKKKLIHIKCSGLVLKHGGGIYLCKQYTKE